MTRKTTFRSALLLLFALLTLPSAAQDVTLTRQSNVSPNDGAVAQQEYAKRYPDATKTVNYQQTGIPSVGSKLVANAKKRPNKATAKAGATPVTITGHLIAHKGYNNNKLGLYTFPATADLTETSLWLNYNFAAGASGFVKDGKYYYTRLISNFGYNFAYAAVLDLETGKFVLSSKSATPANDCQSITTANLVYDATTDKVYGQFYETDYTLSNVFGTLEYNETGNWKRTEIAKLQNRYVAMAVNSQGQIYGIDINGRLNKIDKTNGTETLVGQTGVTPNANRQAATSDPKTGEIYWAAMTDDGSALYRVDPTTATATKIHDFADGDQFASLYIPAPEAEDGAPTAITDLKAGIEHSNLNAANVTFTMPAKTYDGTQTLSGSLNYAVYSGTDTIKGTAEAGQSVSLTMQSLPDGNNDIYAYTTNSVGNSPKAKVSVFAGPDKPQGPTAVSLSANGKDVTLTWQAPSDTGVNKGYIDPATITYDVIRYPGAVKVADHQQGTSFSETLTTDSMFALTYGIVAYSGNNASEEVKSNKVVIGDYLLPPYTQGFDDESSLDLFTILDSNNDGTTWEYNRYSNNVRYRYNRNNAADDWLLTPALKLEADKSYKFSFKVKAGSTSYPEKIAMAYGEGTDPSKYEVALEPTEIKSTDFIVYNFTIANLSGNIHFGFHALSDANMSGITIDDISIDEGTSVNAPDSVKAITLTPGAKGALSGQLQFTAPSKTIKGDALTAISKVVVLQGDSTVATVSNVSPGTVQTVSLNNVANGYNTYTILPYNESGKGREASATEYFGIDLPTYPDNISLKDNGDGTLKMTWDAVPTTGIRGGYVDPAEVTYVVYTVENNALGQPIDSIKAGTSINFKVANINSGDQGLDYYAVQPHNALGGGQAIMDRIVVGAPVVLPFKESVPGGVLQEKFWWSQHRGDNTWGYSTSSADDDGGSLQFSAAQAGDEAWMNTAKFSLEGVKNPILSYAYYVYPGHDIDFTVEASKAQQSVENIASHNMKGETAEGWRYEYIPLTKLSGAKYAFLQFHAKSAEAAFGTNIDDIHIYDAQDNDLALATKAPLSAYVSEKVSVNATVSNLGLNPTKGSYTVSLYANGKLVDKVSADSVLAALSGKKQVSLSFTPSAADSAVVSLRTELTYDGDADVTNNNDTLSLRIVQNSLPAVDNLTGQGETNVSLSWTQPSGDNYEADKLDDFEGYPAWSKDIIGDYKLLDIDRAPTYGISGASYLHKGEAMAYMVFDADSIGMGGTAQFGAHSGKQYLIDLGVNPSNSAAPNGSNDDWLISPQLTGKAQTISFYAKSLSNDYKERYEVLYSTTGRDTADFKRIVLGGDELNQASWSQVKVELPDGAKYFAIRCTSHDAFGFLIDDLSYKFSKSGVSGTLTGYNIYRDGVLIATVGATTTSYTDNPGDGNHTYYVTAIYDGQEGPLSNAVSITVTTGISGVNGSAVQPFDVYTTDGILMRSNVTSTKGLNKGVYIVNGQKVIVR